MAAKLYYTEKQQAKKTMNFAGLFAPAVAGAPVAGSEYNWYELYLFGLVYATLTLCIVVYWARGMYGEISKLLTCSEGKSVVKALSTVALAIVTYFHLAVSQLCLRNRALFFVSVLHLAAASGCQACDMELEKTCHVASCVSAAALHFSYLCVAAIFLNDAMEQKFPVLFYSVEIGSLPKIPLQIILALLLLILSMVWAFAAVGAGLTGAHLGLLELLVLLVYFELEVTVFKVALGTRRS
jgi:hypothetical protein